MRLGISVSSEDLLKKIRSLDQYVDYFEVFTQTEENIETIRDHIHRIKIVHLPDLNNKCIESLIQASKLEIDKVVVHLFTENPMEPQPKMETLRNLSKVAQDYDIKLCLENTEEKPSEISDVIEQVPDLLFCLDIGHGYLFKNQPTDYIETISNYIAHVHIHDNFGGAGEEFDRHLVPGEGCIDFCNVLSGLVGIGYRDTFTLELTPFDDLSRKIDAIKKTRKLLNQYLN